MAAKLKSPDAFFIQVDVLFATEYGVNEAILAGKLLRLITKLTGAMDEAGNKWVRLTLDEWAAELPFMSEMTIRRTLESLKKKTIVLTRTFTGRSKWYRLNPDFIDDNATVQNEQIPPENGPSVQNEQLVSVQNEHINCSNCTDTSVQNEQLPIILPISFSKSVKNAHADKILSDNRPFAIRLTQLCGYSGPEFVVNGKLTELAEAVTQLLAWDATIEQLDLFARWWWGKTPPTFQQVVNEWGKFKAGGGQPETAPHTPPPLDDAKRSAYLALQAETQQAQAESAARAAAVMAGGIKAAGVDVQKEIRKTQRRLRQ